MHRLEYPPKPGIYTLVIQLKEKVDINVGGLGVQSFPKGLYTYTGSALGLKSVNLLNRIKRHIIGGKRKHWHIDYLLESDSSILETVVFMETSVDLECMMCKKLAKIREAEIVVEGFGSSDCKRGCRSHLSFFPKRELSELVESVKRVYREKVP